MPYEHIPVLLNEVLEYLNPQSGHNFVDATLGGGGYTSAILARTAPDGQVLATDLDQDAIDNFKARHPQLATRCTLVHGNFAQIDTHVTNHQFTDIQGMVADLGLSSYELENRGISFQTDEPLDMRFDRGQNIKDAKLVVNDYLPEELVKIFQDYGEEPFTRQIVKKIINARNQHQITRTRELYQIIEEALPKPVKHKAADSARRIFQALRIEVNQELQSLEEFLPRAFDILAPGGRLVVVSFHSLEDRIVKNYFNGLSKGCICPPDFPQCVCGRNPQAKVLTKKPVTAKTAELAANSRSKPAKLRAMEKI